MNKILVATALSTTLLPNLAVAAADKSKPSSTVSETRMRADVEKLVSFGTRHTLSSDTDSKRGIGAARRWAADEFRKTSKGCGGCLEVVLPEVMVSGTRIPSPVKMVDVVAIQRGTERPNEVVIVQAHIDSRVTDVMDASSDAPGANDDGSGVSLVLESARVLSKRKFASTIVYAALSGEEQGLYGGKLLADYAKQKGWTVKAVLNNDIVGGTRGSDGLVDDRNVRLFSEGPRADSTDRTRADARRFGGENDSPGRNISRFIAELAGGVQGDLAVRQVWRADRMGRGGDQLPFLEQGNPAVRFSVAIEDYEHQHQDLRTENGIRYGDTIDEMDFPYLAKVTRLNIGALAALAAAPMPPTATADGAVKTWTDVTWKPVAGAAAYSVWRRRTDAPEWEVQPMVARTTQTSVKLDGLRGDDWILGVRSIAADGSVSPIAAALPGGGFTPLAPLP